MNPKKVKVLAGRVKKSPSFEAEKRTISKTTLNGGVTVDPGVAIEGIREISKKLNYDILNTTVQRNLVQYSEDFTNPKWVNGGGSPIYSNVIANPVDGALTADLWDDTGNTGTTNQTGLIATSTSITYSIYTKTDTATTRVFLLRNNTTLTNFTTATFNYTTGDFAGAPAGWSKDVLLNGWFRLKYTQTTGITINDNLQIYVGRTGTYAGSTVTWYLYGAQLEAGTVATAYQKTPAQIGASFIYTPSSYGESRNYTQNPYLRNLSKFSEEFDNGIWAAGGSIGRIANDSIAPNGTMTADKITSTGVSNNFITQISNIQSGILVTYSIYLKNIDSPTSQLQLRNATTSGGVQINWSGNTIASISSITGATVSFNALSDDWYRVVVTDVTDEINTGTRIYPDNSNTGKSIYVWGSQLELGSVATPYQRTTDGIIDLQHTRAITSNVTNKDGSIGDGCYNLLLNSALNGGGTTPTSWILASGGGTSTPQTTLINSNTSYRFVTTSNRQFWRQNMQIYIGATYRLSGYVDSVATPVSVAQFLYILDNVGTHTYYEDGVVINGASLIQAGKRYTDELVASFTGLVDVRFGCGSSNTATGDITVSRPQFTIGSIEKPYLKTTNRLNVPSIDYSLSTTKPSLLIQPQRTNLALWSEDFTQLIWTGNNISASLNTTLNPFNVNKSYYIIDNIISSSHYIGQSLTTVSGNIYTASFYVKKADHVWCQFLFSLQQFSNNVWCNFNFDTGSFGTTGSAGTYTATLISNNYYKITVQATAIASLTQNCISIVGTNNTNSSRLFSYTGIGDRIVNIAAIQFEVGSNATSYIPTTTATVTRNGDTSFVDLWNCNMLNKDNFTLYCEGYLYNATAQEYSVVLSETGTLTNNSIGFFNSVLGIAYNGTTLVSTGSALPNNSYYKIAIQRNGNQVKFFRNGIQLGNALTIAVVDYRYLRILSTSTISSTHAISKIALFKATLNDSECLSMTSPQSNTFEDLAYNYQYTLIN